MKKVISIFLLISMHAAFAKPAGTVLFVASKVVAKRGGADITLTRGTGLETGDTIVTAAGASAKIRYLNGTLVSIGSDSNYKILDFSPTQGDVVIKAELKNGKIESQTAGGKKREALKTPVVALAITGTVYKVYAPTNGRINVKLITGEIKANGTIIQPGQSVAITPSGMKPAPFPAAGNVPTSTVNSSNSTSGTSSTTSSTNGTTSGSASSDTSAGTASSSSSDNGSGSTSNQASTTTETNVSVQTNDSTNTSYVSSAVVASTSVSTSTAATTAPVVTPEASISLICLP